VAETAVQLGVIKGQKFAGGGIVGGSSFYGDQVNARVNSGEMILNGSQQAALWNVANNNTTNNSSNQSATFNFHINGNLSESFKHSLRSGEMDTLIPQLKMALGVK
jgi:hypothetical protein